MLLLSSSSDQANVLKNLMENIVQKIQEIETFEQAVALGETILNEYKNRFGTVLISVDHQLIKQALTYIQQHFHEKITLDTVAKKLHLSKNYLCHLFQEETGHKFCEYVSLLRVQHAKKLIEEGKDSFTSISYTCGFSIFPTNYIFYFNQSLDKTILFCRIH